MENLTVCNSSSPALLIQKSSQTAKCPNSSSHINGKRSEENHHYNAARTATSDNAYLSWPKHPIPRSQCGISIMNAIPHLGSQLSSMKLVSQKQNKYAVGHPHVKHLVAPNIPMPTSPKSLLLQGTANDANTKAPPKVSKQKTGLFRLVLSSAGVDAGMVAWIAVVRYKDIDGNFRGNLTSLEYIKAEDFLREPETLMLSQ